MVIPALAASVSALSATHSLLLFQDAVDHGHTVLLEVFVGLVALAMLVQAIAVVGIALGANKAKNDLMKDIAELKAKAMPLIDKSHVLVTDLTPQVKDLTAKVNHLVTDLSPKITDITTKVNALVGDLSPKISAITTKVDTLVGDLSPRISGITENVHQISGHAVEIAAMAKDKAAEFGPTLTAANETALDANRKTQQQIARVNDMVTGALDATAHMGNAVREGLTTPVREAADLVKTAQQTVSSFLNTTRGSVESVVHGSKGYADSLLAGLKGFTSTLFAAKRKPVPYTPAAYRSHPALPTPPIRTGYSDLPEDKF